MQLFSKMEIEDEIITGWKNLHFSNFKSILTDRIKPFPCILGNAGFNSNQLRFAFIENQPNHADAAHQVAALLQSFLPNAKKNW